ncbi:hypothetical protein HDF08_002286 [Edaphobacter lichenicola]|uniref:Uncharacterized protein n=1 Tax=Tunturiibacter lichenicola TaxID=2051959 RepID=A0A852VGP7_9BACT|nr:hypothetical protein [Edaphobacter lichenicola]
MFRYGTELWVIVRSGKGLRCTGTTPRALPGNNLQIAVRMLVRRMPEEWGSSTNGSFADTIDCITRHSQQCESIRTRSVRPASNAVQASFF